MAAWFDLCPIVDRELVALVSNGTTEQGLALQGLDAVADTVVNTARIGVAKPDPRVYRIAAEWIGAPRLTDVCSSTTPPPT
ncbi:hypothetical protein ACFQ7M_35900 [Streptomyces massasporeus]